MIPAVPTALPVAQGGQTPTTSASPARPDTVVARQSKASAGVAAPANLRAETTVAVDASRQATVTPRLRDQETSERSNRPAPSGDGPTGPQPSFEETPMQRASRVIFDPPEAFSEVATKGPTEIETAGIEPPETTDARPEPPEPRQVASRQAEAAFEEARQLETNGEPPEVDVSL